MSTTLLPPNSPPQKPGRRYKQSGEELQRASSSFYSSFLSAQKASFEKVKFKKSQSWVFFMWRPVASFKISASHKISKLCFVRLSTTEVRSIIELAIEIYLQLCYELFLIEMKKLIVKVQVTLKVGWRLKWFLRTYLRVNTSLTSHDDAPPSLPSHSRLSLSGRTHS